MAEIGVFETWADAHGITAAARLDWYARQGMLGARSEDSEGRSESNVSSRSRLEAGRRGYSLWRNNSGVLNNEAGIPVRFGLANDSKRVNQVIKSGDYISCVPTLILPHMVYKTFGLFASLEMKHEDWKYTGTEREVAQFNWNNLVISRGGFARFITSPDQLP